MPRIIEVARSHDVTLSHARCDGSAADPEVVEGWELVLVTRGAFRRETEEGARLVDPTTMYLGRPGQGHLIHHLDGCGDTADLIFVSEALIEPVADRIPALPFSPSAPAVLAARVLLARAARSTDDVALDEAAGAVLERLVGDGPPTVRTGGAGPARAVTERVLERLAHEVESGAMPATLATLAADAGYSPHHLSRTFRAVTGTTISSHRRSLRARAALARIEAGADDLAGVAAEVGFADHSHLVRATRAELGTTPTGLRRLLRDR